MTFTATYSPEDNKLRLSASSRLDKDLYLRVKAAGFAWAPRQEIFVAPAWSPSREDLLIELAGEIGDEDTSLVERAEVRAERFEEYSDKREADAERAHKAVAAIADGIPLGQPILIGHHSERHARKDAEKIENGMRKAVKMWETSKYWESRAAGAIRHAKYKERPDVRARRIKGIKAEVRSLIASYTPHKDAGVIMQTRRNDNTEPYEAREKVPNVWVGPKGRGGYWVEASRIEAIEAGSQRWLNHLNNRLVYERAMLAEGGGLKAEAFDIQVGGRVCRRGEWLIVTKLNMRDGVLNSVSVMGHWSSTMPVEDIQDYRAPADGDAEKVKAVKKLLPLVNFRAEGCKEMTTAEWKQQCRWSESSYVAEFNAQGGMAKRGQIGEGVAVYRQRSVSGRGMTYTRTPVFLTDAKVSAPPAIIAERAPVSFAQVPLEDRPERAVYRQPELTKFDALKETLKAGVQVVSAPQLFPTPKDLARRMVSMAGPMAGRTILEPSAGTGRIIEAAVQDATGFDCCQVVAVEINGSLVSGLQNMRDKWLYANEGNFKIVHGDFLEHHSDSLGRFQAGGKFDVLGTFDVILMNPPFVNAQDIKHIQHAVTFLKPGGVLVSICANGPRQREALQGIAEHWEDLPAGTFEESGTGVNTALLVVRGRN